MQLSPNIFNKDVFNNASNLYVTYASGANPSAGVFDKTNPEQISYYPTYNQGARSIRKSAGGHIFIELEGNNSIRVFNRYNHQQQIFNFNRNGGYNAGIWTIEGEDIIYYATNSTVFKHNLNTGTVWTWAKPSGFVIHTLTYNPIINQLYVAGQSNSGPNLFRVDAGVTVGSQQVGASPNNTIVSLEVSPNGNVACLVNTTSASFLYELIGVSSLILNITSTYGVTVSNISVTDNLIYFAAGGKGFVVDYLGVLIHGSVDATVFAGRPQVMVDALGEDCYVYNSTSNLITKRDFRFANLNMTYQPQGVLVDNYIVTQRALA